MPKQAIKTDGMMPLKWKWMLRVTYSDRFEVAWGESWCPHTAIACASAVLESFDEDEDGVHEFAIVHMWNPTTRQSGRAPLVPNLGPDAAAV